MGETIHVSPAAQVANFYFTSIALKEMKLSGVRVNLKPRWDCIEMRTKGQKHWTLIRVVGPHDKWGVYLSEGGLLLYDTHEELEEGLTEWARKHL